MHRLQLFIAVALSSAALGQPLAPLRAPAVPLVAHDPYFSIWSMTDRLNAENTRHWTGKPATLVSLVRIDGRTYRLMGLDPRRTPALEQTRRGSDCRRAQSTLSPARESASLSLS